MLALLSHENPISPTEYFENTESGFAEQQLVESMDEGYCVIEIVLDDNNRPINYRFISTNPAFGKQTGLQGADGKLITELVPDVERNWIETYAHVALTGQPARFVKEAPSIGRWFDVYSFRLAGSSTRVGALLRDITERKKNEEILREVAQRKDEFLALVAHELRNPLAPMMDVARLLLSDALDGGRLRDTSEVIGRQVKHMTAMIDDLLDMSRVTRSRITLDNEILDLRLVIAHALEQVHPLIRTRGQYLQTQLAPQPLLVTGDSKRLVQVIGNLLNNAAKYTQEHGRIFLKAAATETNIVIEITDNGKGMRPDLLERAFDQFAQAERTSDRASGGLGLGLALVESLVALHGGTVTCSSEGLGKGSTFKVSLPRLQEIMRLEPYTERLGPAKDVRPLRIMVVDDNVDASAVLAMVLESEGHEVFVEFESKWALEQAKTEAPQVYVLDIGLPHMDGYELARQLRCLPEADGAILIAVTGYSRNKDKENAIAAGFDYHLVKPIDFDHLLSILGGVHI